MPFIDLQRTVSKRVRFVFVKGGGGRPKWNGVEIQDGAEVVGEWRYEARPHDADGRPIKDEIGAVIRVVTVNDRPPFGISGVQFDVEIGFAYSEMTQLTTC